MRQQRVLRHVQEGRLRPRVQGVPNRNQVQQDLRRDFLALAADELHHVLTQADDVVGGGGGRVVHGAAGDATGRGFDPVRGTGAEHDMQTSRHQAGAVGRDVEVLQAVAEDDGEEARADRVQPRQAPAPKGREQERLRHENEGIGYEY